MPPNAEPVLAGQSIFAGDPVPESVEKAELGLSEKKDRSASQEPLDLTELRRLGESLELTSAGTGRPADVYAGRLKRLRAAGSQVFALARTTEDTPILSEVRSNLAWLVSDFDGLFAGFAQLPALPQVKTGSTKADLRIVVLAEAFLLATSKRFSDEAFTAFVTGAQRSLVLSFKELWTLPLVIKLDLFEDLIEIAEGSSRAEENSPVVRIIQTLRDLLQAPWAEIIEPLILFDQVLRTDPVYEQMEFASRQLYREQVIDIAKRSACTECEVAAAAITLARTAKADGDERRQTRISHVGYYLIGEGRAQLGRRVRYRATLRERLFGWFGRHPDWGYVPSIALLTTLFVLGFALTLTYRGGLSPFTFVAALLFALPASELSVWLVNFLLGVALKPRALPKLNYDSGLPANCRTLVAVPTLLLSEQQVRTLVQNLETRFVGNQDANLFFALLSDLPDSKEPAPEHHPLLDLAVRLVNELNQKYRVTLPNRFFLLHRRPFYNPHEGVWMGWERKRGKLLDLNNFLQGESDPFPVKAGDISVLSAIRYVITLDADTELPCGAGRRLVGTLAHPLNQAVIDPVKNLVVQGYGLLQPRVRISIESSTRSRLARIYSGRTGLDIYSCAISDVYQDLFGEGSFAGKGIYDVSVLQTVLAGRFPCNALLSHDLIEGAYARAGLVSDVEVIEDCPSRYAAHNKRKHRWIRGDWQVAGWLRPSIRDEKGNRVPNPISFCSRWKIADNLRRSLVELATFLFLLSGWVFEPNAAGIWTVVGLALFFAPALFRFAFELLSLMMSGRFDRFSFIIDALVENLIGYGLTLVFLPHQAMLSLDAIARTIWRKITHRKLLEWETAAQAEINGARRTAIDRYLAWTALLALAIAGFLAWFEPTSFFSAAPLLLLWAISRPTAQWLNGPVHRPKAKLPEPDQAFVRLAAWRTWRYFAELSRAENNWLIPDNLQFEPRRLAERMSPTNLGLLLNARQVAREFGFLTLPELANLTLRTLETVERLPKYRGHLFNWYDTQTLAAAHPRFVSTVDSGNLLASLLTLQQGGRSILETPLVPRSLFTGVADLLVLLCEDGVFAPAEIAQWTTALRGLDWCAQTAALNQLISYCATRQPGSDGNWFGAELQNRLDAIQETVSSFTPWLCPEFKELASALGLVQPDRVRDLASYADQVTSRLAAESDRTNPAKQNVQVLLDLCVQAQDNIAGLLNDLEQIDRSVTKLADQTEFGFLLNKRRKLLSIGFDFDHLLLPPACYDLLASEARTAAFLAVVRGELPVKSWFRLGRTPASGFEPVVSSWTGTMFEYFMPALWMRSYPETMLEQAMVGALRRQQARAHAEGVPWGISECAHAIRDPAGNYGYQAFGDPSVAVSADSGAELVISPYSTFLALPWDPVAAVKNLRQMAEYGWVGEYGFYEAADFRESGEESSEGCELIRCWMAHHQGMSLLAAANLLLDGIVQNWFHSDVRVRATEMLLQEKPLPSSAFDRIFGAMSNWFRPVSGRQPRRKRRVSAEFGWTSRSAISGSALSSETV